MSTYPYRSNRHVPSSTKPIREQCFVACTGWKDKKCDTRLLRTIYPYSHGLNAGQKTHPHTPAYQYIVMFYNTREVLCGIFFPFHHITLYSTPPEFPCWPKYFYTHDASEVRMSHIFSLKTSSRGDRKTCSGRNNCFSPDLLMSSPYS